MLAALDAADIPVTGASVRTRQADIWITADPTHPIAPQIGHAARALTAAAPRRIDEFGITVGTEHGLETATVAVMRWARCTASTGCSNTTRTSAAKNSTASPKVCLWPLDF